MGDLGKGVHACVGASGPARYHLLARERPDGLDEAVLHRRAVLLHLPANERGPVIFEGKLVAGHRR